MEKKKTALEAIAGNPAVGLAAAAAAAVTPDGLATVSMVYALLPVLTTTLAYGRQQARLNQWMTDVDTGLRLLGDRITEISDAQQQLTVGIVQVAFETVDKQKLRLLKAAILNVAGSTYLEHFHAQLFSRILRDVSAAEIAFLAKWRAAPGFTFQKSTRGRDEVLSFDPASADALLIRGLISLGLIVRSASEGTYGDIAQYLIAPFVPQLLELVADSNSARRDEKV